MSKEEAENLYNDLEFDYFMETSAKTGFNAEKIFVQAAKMLYKDYLDYHEDTESRAVVLQTGPYGT